ERTAVAVAETESPGHGDGDAATLQVQHRLGRAKQLLVVELAGRRQREPVIEREPRRTARWRRRFVPGGRAAVRWHVPQALQRLAKAHSLGPPDEVDHVAAGAAAEAVEGLRLGVEVEAGGAVLVERAASHQPLPLPPQ